MEIITNLRGNIIVIIDFQLKMNNACYGVTKDPNENDYLLISDFEKVTWKYKIDELINKLQNTLNNKLINENDLSVKTTELLNELLETLKIIENCASCKDKEMNLINAQLSQKKKNKERKKKI